MTRPQLENGYLRIANELAEAFAQVNLSPYEWRILWVIVRKTYGFNKAMDQISYRQLAEAADIKLWHVKRTVDGLVEKNMIIKKKVKNSFSYGLQKDYSKWASVTATGNDSETLPNEVTKPPTVTATGNVTSTGNKSVTSTGNKNVTATGNNKRQKTRKTCRTSDEDATAPKFTEDDNAYRCAVYFRKKVLEVNDNTPVPDENPEDLERWAIACDRLNRLGPAGGSNGYSWSQLKEMFDWAFADEFWKYQLASPVELRKKRKEKPPKIITLENRVKRDRGSKPYVPPEE